MKCCHLVGSTSISCFSKIKTCSTASVNVLLLLFYLHQTLQGTIPSKTLAKIFLPKPKFSRKIKDQTRAFPKTDKNVSEMTARLTGGNGNELWIV